MNWDFKKGVFFACLDNHFSITIKLTYKSSNSLFKNG